MCYGLQSWCSLGNNSQILLFRSFPQWLGIALKRTGTATDDTATIQSSAIKLEDANLHFYTMYEKLSSHFSISRFASSPSHTTNYNQNREKNNNIVIHTLGFLITRIVDSVHKTKRFITSAFDYLCVVSPQHSIIDLFCQAAFCMLQICLTATMVSDVGYKVRLQYILSSRQ